MTRLTCVLSLVFSSAAFGAAGQESVVFRSDVSLVRVDAEVVDRDHRAITGLRAEDFLLREEGRPQQISNFARESIPLDVLLLFDVSASMRPHVERIASAAHQALAVLGDRDRVALMVFDRSTRVRLPFRNSREDVERELQSLLRQETFRGGTDITRALLDAAEYIGREGRHGARRAIVILTDDRTERERDEASVSRAFTRSDAVLSALIAPDALADRQWGGGRGRNGGGGWPGTGGSGGGPLGGIILGRRGPYGGGRGPGRGGGMGGPHTQSAGTSEIARQSGGDSMPVQDASALEDTLERLRQRYALHFHLPQGVKPGEERNIEVELAGTARSRYPGAEVHFRRVYLAPGAVAPGAAAPEPVAVASAPVSAQPADASTPRRRPAVNGPISEGPVIRTDSSGSPDAAAPAPSAPPAPSTSGGDNQDGHGWRRVKPGEQ